MSFGKAVIRMGYGSVVLGMLLFLVQCSGKECYYDTDCGTKQRCTENTCRNIIPLPDQCSSNSDCKGTGQTCVKGQCVMVPAGYEYPEPPPEYGPEPKPEPKPEFGPEPLPEPDAGPEPEPDLGPTSCNSDIDCASLNEHVCAVDLQAGGRTCQPIHKGGKKFKEACDPAAAAPGNCESRTCHPTRKVCTKSCGKDADCPSGVCESVKIGSGTYGVCLASDNECNRDQDCGTGNNNDNLCVLNELSGVSLVTRCGTAIGQGNAGESCFGDGDCKHNNCFKQDGACSKFCITDADCGQGFKCELEEIPRFGKKFPFKICKYPAEGLPCTTDKECKRSGYICVPTKVGSKLELRCQNPAGAKYDETCKDGKDCRSGVCLTNSGLKCSKPCTADADCTRSGGDVKCANVLVELDNTKQSLKMCVPLYKACSKLTDCQKDLEVCAPHIDDSGAFSMRCLDNNTAADPVGADCADNDHCQSRICHKGQCAALCASASECGVNSSLAGKQGFGCTPEKIQFTGKPDISAMLCTVPAVGLKCEGQATGQCPSKTNDTCRIVESGSTLERRCRPKLANATKKLGDDCTKDADCDTGTCLLPDGICTAPCSSDSECTGGGIKAPLRCLEREFKPGSGGTAVKFNVCSYVYCKGDPDCNKGQVCRYIKNSVDSFLGCVQPTASEKAAGETCTANADCRSNLCHPTKKICSSPCEGGQDASCPLQYACEQQGSGPSQLHLCLPLSTGCLHNGECKSGEVCVYSLDASGRPRQTCGNALGSRPLGEFCDPDAKTPQCQTGFCDPKTRRCSQFCSLASHCPKDSYRCTTITVSVGSGKDTKTYDLQACRSVLCRHNGDCQSGEVCKVSFVQGTGAVKKCAAPASGEKAVDQACSLDTDCATGLCGTNGGTKVCLALCSAHRHCSDSAQCGEVTYITTKVTACLKGTRSSCSGDNDCATGEVCQVNFVGGKPVAQCRTKGIELPAGATCNPQDGFPGKCASHLCDSVTNKCLSVCAPGLNDCSSGEVCDDFNILNQPISACIPPPTVCTKAADCAQGTVCGVTLVQTTLQYLCLRTVAGRPKKVGETCDPAAAFPGNCQTSLCHPQLKVCVNTCQQDADCKDSSRPLCGKIVLSNGLLARACIPKNATCNRDAECPATEPVCGLELSNNQIERKCSRGSTFGNKKVGETCNPSNSISKSECLNRFCEAGRRICTAVCTANSHCSTGLVCGETFVEGTKRVLGCIPPVDAACKRATDCALPSACRALRETSGVVAKCQSSGGKDLQATCAPTTNDTITTECRSGICHPSSKRCTSVCEKDSDCGLGACRSITLEGFKVNVCDVSCTKNSDCPTGQLCGVVLVGQTKTLACIKPNNQKQATDDPCDPAKVVDSSDCQTSFCNPATSKCTSVCDADADCPSGMLCATSFVRLNTTTVAAQKGCVPATGSCASPTHCPTNLLCQLETRGGKVNSDCKTPDLQRKPEGNACSSTTLPGDCRTGLCDPKSGQCTTFCTKDSECTKTPRTKCATLSVGGASVSACVKP